jgi:hypothetical protein
MEQPTQCPFIDRVDHRCSSAFSLERLDHAFEVCFDQFKACPLFKQLMAERRERRAAGDAVTGHNQPGVESVPTLWVAGNDSRAAHAVSRFVQVRVSRVARGTIAASRHAADAHALAAASAPRLPVASGL